MNTEPTFTTETVLKNIVKTRKEKGLTYDNMAHELTISPPAYRKIELGITHLTVDRLHQIAAILQTEVALCYYYRSNSSTIIGIISTKSK